MQANKKKPKTQQKRKNSSKYSSERHRPEAFNSGDGISQEWDRIRQEHARSKLERIRDTSSKEWENFLEEYDTKKSKRTWGGEGMRVVDHRKGRGIASSNETRYTSRETSHEGYGSRERSGVREGDRARNGIRESVSKRHATKDTGRDRERVQVDDKVKKKRSVEARRRDTARRSRERSHEGKRGDAARRSRERSHEAKQHDAARQSRETSREAKLHRVASRSREKSFEIKLREAASRSRERSLESKLREAARRSRERSLEAKQKAQHKEKPKSVSKVIIPESKVRIPEKNDTKKNVSDDKSLLEKVPKRDVSKTVNDPQKDAKRNALDKELVTCSKEAVSKETTVTKSSDDCAIILEKMIIKGESHNTPNLLELNIQDQPKDGSGELVQTIGNQTKDELHELERTTGDQTKNELHEPKQTTTGDQTKDGLHQLEQTTRNQTKDESHELEQTLGDQTKDELHELEQTMRDQTADGSHELEQTTGHQTKDELHKLEQTTRDQTKDGSHELEQTTGDQTKDELHELEQTTGDQTKNASIELEQMEADQPKDVSHEYEQTTTDQTKDGLGKLEQIARDQARNTLNDVEQTTGDKPNDSSDILEETTVDQANDTLKELGQGTGDVTNVALNEIEQTTEDQTKDVSDDIEQMNSDQTKDTSNEPLIQDQTTYTSNEPFTQDQTTRNSNDSLISNQTTHTSNEPYTQYQTTRNSNDQLIQDPLKDTSDKQLIQEQTNDTSVKLVQLNAIELMSNVVFQDTSSEDQITINDQPMDTSIELKEAIHEDVESQVNSNFEKIITYTLNSKDEQLIAVTPADNEINSEKIADAEKFGNYDIVDKDKSANTVIAEGKDNVTMSGARAEERNAVCNVDGTEMTGEDMLNKVEITCSGAIIEKPADLMGENKELVINIDAGNIVDEAIQKDKDVDTLLFDWIQEEEVKRVVANQTCADKGIEKEKTEEQVAHGEKSVESVVVSEISGEKDANGKEKSGDTVADKQISGNNIKITPEVTEKRKINDKVAVHTVVSTPAKILTKTDGKKAGASDGKTAYMLTTIDKLANSFADKEKSEKNASVKSEQGHHTQEKQRYELENEKAKVRDDKNRMKHEGDKRRDKRDMSSHDRDRSRDRSNDGRERSTHETDISRDERERSRDEKNRARDNRERSTHERDRSRDKSERSTYERHKDRSQNKRDRSRDVTDTMKDSRSHRRDEGDRSRDEKEKSRDLRDKLGDDRSKLREDNSRGEKVRDEREAKHVSKKERLDDGKLSSRQAYEMFLQARQEKEKNENKPDRKGETEPLRKEYSAHKFQHTVVYDPNLTSGRTESKVTKTIGTKQTSASKPIQKPVNRRSPGIADTGDHKCGVCDVSFTTLTAIFKHLHSLEHKKVHSDIYIMYVLIDICIFIYISIHCCIGHTQEVSL